MNHCDTLLRASYRITSLLVGLLAFSAIAQAHQTGAQHLHFQKPGDASSASANRAGPKFRAPASRKKVASREKVQPSIKRTQAKAKVKVKAKAKPVRRRTASQASAPQPRAERKSKKVVSRKIAPRQDRQVMPIAHGQVVFDSSVSSDVVRICHTCGGTDNECICQPAYESSEYYEPGCGLGEPGCGFSEPGCGVGGPSLCGSEPGCGLGEPGCGLGEPSCGVVGCGSCVGAPGPDYWCFPVCLPRLKDLSVWAGVQGFRGPRDFAGGRSDSNFGFNQGINLSGRAPLLGLVFPQLSYQLGYQAVQSRLSGTLGSADDRGQQFVTAGLFRRVNTGLQYGVAWDLMSDDLDIEADFHQVRTELSIKSPRGREFGVWTATSTNDATVGGVTYQTVDQYALFYRWNFRGGATGRLWGGSTGDSEGIFGGEFQAPLNDRWSLQTGFNYLITDENAGSAGVQQESWNLGMRLVWHLGRTARTGHKSPFQPLFTMADNGWMFIDAKP